MTTALWVLVAVLILVGLVGTVLPALPGVVLVFAGILLGAWIDDFHRVSVTTVVLLGVLGAVALLVDFLAGVLTAQRVGATRLGLLGAAIGTVAGVFTGFVGLLFLPLAGAAVGEYLSHRDALRAGRIGVVTWLGMLAGAVVKLAIAFAMVGWFVGALLIA
jgi:hypothetical protein